MTPYLRPCSACSRHILSSEAACPFCGSAIRVAPLPEPRKPRGRLSRAALVALGTAASAPGVACGNDQEESVTPVYRGPGGDGDGDMSGDGDTPASGGASATGGAPTTGGGPNEGGMGGEVESSGGADEMGAGGDQLIPVYGQAPRPFR